ncbi:MAG: hypothetical protein K9N46_15025 [Candidatus Marinimicrobia bacterium]|nr:hypothetical protein [Candidatus Neomarinimicrobiota bacterium]MCF7828533.1 hypothetical protein [Candidatus Neomarinimicrobiota bacterium]MCF7882044.1 hypothetical protein [Candidatus Neomarinimicrobiota bacterium]
MKKYIILFCIGLMSAGGLFAQSDAYKNAYQEAMRDSVITSDERAMLNSLQKSLGLTEDQVLEYQRQYAESPDTTRQVSHEGRAYAIGLTMFYGNVLYGWGIPFVLGVENSQIYVGLQGIAAAGGFYYSWKKTETMDLPQSRVTMLAAGSSMGWLSTFPLISTVGWERWFDFDPDGKLMVTYMMFAVPYGVYQGEKLYQRWQPSDGQANLITSNLGYGALNGYTAFALLVKSPSKIDNPEAYLRTASLITYGSALAGGYLSHKYFKEERVTTGDAAFYNLGGLAGTFTAFRLMYYFEIDEYKSVLGLLTGSIDLGLYAAHRLNASRDLTLGDAGIVGLGGLAGMALVRGISFLGDFNDADFMTLVDIPAGLGGAYYTYQLIAPKTNTNRPNQGAHFQLTPTMIADRNQLYPGMNFSAQW